MSLVKTSVKFSFQENNPSTATDRNSRHRILVSKKQKLAIHSNQQGTNTLASDLKSSSMDSQQGALRHINSYSPYGYSRVTEGVAALVKFNGERSDSHSGLYFLGHGVRCFSTALMRFYSPDQLSPFDAGGLNCYAYCSGDPVNYSDPSGRKRASQYIDKKIGPSTRAEPLRRKEMHHTAPRARPSSVIDIPRREQRLNNSLLNTHDSKFKELKPNPGQIIAGFNDERLVEPENYGKDSYIALYQESKAFRAYGSEAIDRKLAGEETMDNWRVAGYNLINFEIAERELLVKIIRGNMRKRWARPSVKNVFGVSR